MLYRCNSILERKVEMWVENLPNGKVRFVERYTDYITGKQKRVSVTMDKNTPKNRRLAIELLNKKMQNKTETNPNGITLEQLIEKYREYQFKTVKLSTYRRNENVTNSFIKIFGGDSLVNKYTAAYVNDKFLSTGRESYTLNEYLTRFKALIRWGYNNDYIEDISYLNKLTRFKDITYRSKIEDKYMEPEEVNTLLSYIEGTKEYHYLYFTKFLLLSGLRVGEAIALKVNDIDFNERLIHVNKTFDPNSKVETPPKTAQSIRDVYIQDDLLPLLQQAKIYSKEQKTIHDTHNDYFFVAKNGGRIHYEAYSKYMRHASETCLGRRVKVHALRHTHASLLLAEGVSIDLISRRLGHENSKITREIYLHITEKLKKRDNEILRGINLF